MPARLTPAQKTFGIGLLPEYEMFRPPEGMEFDPAYSNFTRDQQGLAAQVDLQRKALQQQRDEFSREQKALQAEDAAFAEMKKRPDEIPNILRSFPELARSKNFDNVLQYAQAVDPSAAQKTLSASLRSRLKPHELQYYDQHFGTHGDALAASDFAKLQGEHENGLVDMMKSGVPLDVIDKYRDRPLSPIERETLIQQHTKKPVNDLSPLMKSGMEELMKLEASGDAAGAARLNNFLVNQGLHINKAAKIIPVPEEEDALATPGSTTSTGKRGSKVNPAFEEYRKLYQSALEREARAREEAAKADEFPLKDEKGNVIPPKAPPQPHELESSKIVQQALQHLNYDPRSNTLIPAIQEPIAGANPQAFAQSALSVANSGNRIVSPVDYSAVEMEPYAGVNAPEFSGLPEQRFNVSGIPQVQTITEASTAPSSIEDLGMLEQELSRIPVTEQAAWLEKRRKEATEAAEINKAWTAAKQSLEEKLKEKYPDKPYPGLKTSPLEQLALQIHNGQLIENSEASPNYETGEMPKIPLAEKVLKELKIGGYGGEKAFTEPGNKRKSFFGLIGSQDVSQSELIRDWADKFLKQRNLIPKALTEETALRPSDPAKIEGVMNEILASAQKP